MKRWYGPWSVLKENRAKRKRGRLPLFHSGGTDAKEGKGKFSKTKDEARLQVPSGAGSEAKGTRGTASGTEATKGTRAGGGKIAETK